MLIARALSFVGCAVGSVDVIEDADDTVPSELDASPSSAVLPAKGDGGAPDGSDQSEAGAAGAADAGCTKAILINEVQVQGSVAAADEFIELRNPGSCSVDVGGMKVEIRSKTGAAPTVIHQFATTATLAPGAYFVIGGVAFSGPKDVTASAELDAVGGQIGLLHQSGAIVDALGYGTSTTGGYVEKTPAPAPPAGQSIGRAPSALDTDDNAADFRVGSPTPRASNK